jgi:amino acid transporter
VSLTGGTYAYVETAFGPYVGFLAGALFWFGSEMISSAAVAVVLVGSLAALVPAAGGAVPRAALLVVLFAALAAVNIRGVRTGARLVEVITAAKLAPLVLLVVAGLFAGEPRNLAWSHTPSVGDVGRASLVLIFAFTGTEGALTPSGEVRNPARTVPRAVLLGLAVTTALYAAVQLAAQGILGPELAREQSAPLAAAASRALGSGGRAFILAGATVSTLGYLSGNMLAAPRLLFAFARDGLLPARLGAVHERFRTPYVAIAAHAALGCAFALTGSFRALAVLSVVSGLLIYLACCLATLELRRRGVRADGAPFRTPGGPAVPVLACLVVLWLLSSATRAEFIAVAEVLGVASVLYLLRRWRRRITDVADVEAG